MMSAGIVTHRSNARFVTRGETREPGNGKLEHRNPLDIDDADVRGDDLEVPRDDRDVHIAKPRSAHELQNVLVRRPREGEHDTGDSATEDRIEEIPLGAEDRHVRHICVQDNRIIVEEADDLDVVLRVAANLAGDRLPHLAGADDHRPLRLGPVRNHALPERSTTGRDNRIPTSQKKTTLSGSGGSSHV